MISGFFINRPRFAFVISIVLTLAGVVALFTLPVAQYPNITPGQVSVSTTYPGADAQTVQETVFYQSQLEKDRKCQLLSVCLFFFPKCFMPSLYVHIHAKESPYILSPLLRAIFLKPSRAEESVDGSCSPA